MPIPHIINEVSHDTRHTLAHGSLFTGYLELSRDVNGRLSSVILWTSSGKTQKIRETSLSRDVSGVLTSVTKKQYDASGTLVETMSLALTMNTSGQLTSLAVVKS
jgi:hypothetical protein